MLATGLGLAALVPGIDGDALIGAFAGGTLFVVSTPSMPLWQRVIYFLISAIAGYMATPDLLAWIPFKSSGLAAFFASAVIVSVTLAVIEKGKKLDFSWLRRGGPPSA
nr:putative holin [Pseudoxanthomonas sp. PXM02]